MKNSTGILIIFATLFVGISCVSAATPWVVKDNSSSVEYWQTVSPGDSITAYMLLGFHEDFIIDQNLTFTSDLEDASWNYSIYLKEPPTFDVKWYPQPKISANTLVIPSTGNIDAFYDAVKVEVKGKVPSRVNGTNIILEKAVRFDNSTGAIFDSFVINRTLTNGTAPTTPPTTLLTTVATTTAKPTTKKSPLESIVVIFGVLAGAAFVIGTGRRQK